MNFGIFYDNRAETHCNVNPAITGDQPTGQMFGGYYAGLPPDQGDNWTHYYHNGALYSDRDLRLHRHGLHQMPATLVAQLAELPPPAPYATARAPTPTSPGRGSGRWPDLGRPTRPAVRTAIPVWEGHYTYPGSN